MKMMVRAFIISIGLGTAIPAMSADILNWSAGDAMSTATGDIDLALDAGTVQGLIRNYTPGSAIMSSSVSSEYTENSIYGIIQVENTEGTAATTIDTSAGNRMDESTPSLWIGVDGDSPLADQAVRSIASLVWFDLDTPAGATDNISAMSFSTFGGGGIGDVTLRFAIQSGGTWFVSEDSATEVDTDTTVNYAGGKFAALTVADASSTNLMSAESLDYAGGFEASELDNITAVGFFQEGTTPSDSARARVKLDSFSASVGTPPVPPGDPDESVLAYNTDSVREDFEYVKSGIGFTLNIISEGNNPSASNGSLDGSLGSFFDPNSASTNDASRPWAGRGDSPFVAEMTIENISTNASLDLSGFHFDLYRHQVASTSIRRYELEYIGGDLDGVSSGLVYGVTVNADEFARYFETNIVEGVTNITDVTPYGDFDWTFATEGNTPSDGPVTYNAMADTRLAFGESASFRLTLKTSTDAATEENQARMDNIAFLGSLYSVGFGSWIGGFDLASEDLDAEDDPDGDGLTSLEEYGRNGNPNDINDTGAPSTYSADGSVFTYVHPQRSDLGNGLAYYLEINDDLVFGTWTNADYSVIDTNVTGEILDYVTNTIPSDIKDKQFIRLIIEQL